MILLDNGRTRVLRDEVGRQALRVHPLQRLPQRLPGLRAHRRPRVRLRLSGADRRDPDAAARGSRRRHAVVAVRVEPLRRLLRRVPGEDRHPATCSLHLRGACRAREDAAPRPGADRAASGSRAIFADREALRAGAAAGAARAPGCSLRRAAPARAAARVDAGARPAGRPGADLPRLVAVGAAMSAAREEILGAGARRARRRPTRPEVASRALPAGRRARAAELVELFAERIADYRATVRRADR